MARRVPKKANRSSYDALRDHNELRKNAARIKHWVLMASGDWAQHTHADGRRLILNGKAVRFATVDEMLGLEGL